jgi:hypothetical protein
VFYQLVANDILLNQNITNGEVYVDLDGVVKQTGSGVLAPPYTVVFARFSTDLNNIVSLTDERVKNAQNIIRGLLADVRDVRAGAAASEGTSGRVSDAMHKHNILTGAPSSQTPDQANSEGSSVNLARADHIHEFVTAAPSTPLAPSVADAQGSSTSFSRADHTHSIQTALTADITTILPNDAADAGVADNYARGDHKHAIAAAAASTITPDQANSEGASTSFARADHGHQVVTAAPITTLSPAVANAQGSASSFSRSDHTHAIATALVGDITTIQPDATADAGTANTYARGDHRHAIVAAAASTQTPDQANSEGVSTSFARADHGHNIPTAAPSTIGTANAQGSANSFAKSDHIHDHGSQTTPTHHAAATTSANGFMSSTDKTKLDAMVFGFLSYTNSGSQSTTQNNTAYTAITLDTDTGSFANSLLTKSSATQFRTDFNGYIRISVKILAQNTSSNDVAWRAAISKNGTPMAHTEMRANGKTNADRYSSVAGTFMVQCAVNDLFTVGFSNAEAATTNTISINAANHATMNVHALYKTS